MLAPDQRLNIYIVYSTDLMQRRTRMQVTVYRLHHARTPAPELH